MSNTDEHWGVGKLVRLNTSTSFVKLCSHFSKPNIIWEPIDVFWGDKDNVSEWGIRDSIGQTMRAPSGPLEWVRAIQMECAWDLGKIVHQREMAREIHLETGTILMVVDVVITSWKKTWRPLQGRKRLKPRFSYVKFLTSINDRTTYVYHDISNDWYDPLINDWVFDIIQK